MYRTAVRSISRVLLFDFTVSRFPNLRLLRNFFIFVRTISGLVSVQRDPIIYQKKKKTSFVAGLFAYSHMDFDVDRNTNETGDPSLAEMTIKALRILQNNPNGYFLFVEGKSESYDTRRKERRK